MLALSTSMTVMVQILLQVTVQSMAGRRKFFKFKTEKSMFQLTARFFLNSIPKIQSLAHAYYFLHSEVSFIQNTKMLSPRKTTKKRERKMDIRTNKEMHDKTTHMS